ncbi:TetR family transcriptional regulator [Pseudomonas sp. LRF_L74]|uniref:TetR family transcriptional regulator n=1 Tax=Pseudomonas sp. LRF_L74 TaxID=3369422 RepID=UPI003F635551
MARRTKEEAEETRMQILDAAERTFHDHGVSHTSLNDIAAAAGVTRGAIYWHFENKGDVFQAMLDRLRLPLDDLAQACENEDEPDPLGHMQKLLIKLLTDVEHDSHRRCVSEILHYKCEYSADLGDLRQKMQALSRDCDQRITLSLSNAIKRGQLPADLDCQRAATCMYAYIEGLHRHWLLDPSRGSLADNAQWLVATLFDMLRLSPTLRRN